MVQGGGDWDVECGTPKRVGLGDNVDSGMSGFGELWTRRHMDSVVPRKVPASMVEPVIFACLLYLDSSE